MKKVLIGSFVTLLFKIRKRYCTKVWLASADAGFWFFLGLAFFGSMTWAVSRDPFHRVWFKIKTPNFGKAEAVAVLPKPARKLPVVYYIYGSGGSLITSGNTLRQLAELGMATVTLEYNQTNAAAFDEQFASLQAFVSKQQWADTNRVVWIGASLGAQRTINFLAHHPEATPQVYVRIGGGLPSEKFEVLSSKFKVLLVHGERDEVFPLEQVRKLEAIFQSNSVPVQTHILPGKGHMFESDRGLLMRCVGEKLKAMLTPENTIPQFPVTKDFPFIVCIAPAFLWGGYWLYLRRQLRPREPMPDSPPNFFEKLLRCTAAVLAVWAIAETAIHLIPPRLAISENTLAVARWKLIAPKWTEDFDTLAFQPFWRGRNLKTLLTHVELSNYCVYELINWKLPKDIYNQYVLSPIIDEMDSGALVPPVSSSPHRRDARATADSELNWRRPLWEFFYPRIRKENDTQSAAEIIVRNLRERVTIDEQFPHAEGIESIWKNQITSPQGFERIYVATLRSSGVPARLGKNGKAEFWTESGWKFAPRPLIEMLTANDPEKSTNAKPLNL